MCFYSVTDYQCGDWKWGALRERCPRQHQHIGQVCKAKLVHTETSCRVDRVCRTCEAIQVKHRRLVKVRERIEWKRKNGGFENSLARMEREMAEILLEINGLEASRESKKSVRLASSSAAYAAAAAAAGTRSNASKLVSNGRAWEPSCDCQSPTAEMMKRLPMRW